LSEKDEQMSTTAREKKYCSKKQKEKEFLKLFQHTNIDILI
jgi:hypothetical protein